MREVILFLSVVAAAIAYDRPRFRLGNGTLLEENIDMIIPRGTSIELYCSGNGRNLKILELSLSRKSVRPRNVTTYGNQTSVRYFNEYSKCGSYFYHCVDTETHHMTSLTILVEMLPVVVDFKCMIDSVDSMHCDWKTDNAYVNKASLSYEKDGILTRLCQWESVKTQSNRCPWDRVYSPIPFRYIEILQSRQTLTFIVKACVKLGCSEQKYQIDPKRIVKTTRPALTILGKTYNSVTLLYSPDKTCEDTDVEIWDYMYFYELENFDCRITYVQAGIQEFRLNYTAAAVFDGFNGLNTINLTIPLPCPETYYEVKVSVKPSWSLGEEYWSDEGEVSFVTEPAPEGVDPICVPQRYKITPDVMLADLDRFRSRMKGELRALRERMQALRLKADHYKQRFEENVDPDFQD